MDRRDWCISTTRIPVFRKRQRCTRSRNKVREGPGKTWLQVRHPIKHDGRCSPKTQQTNKQTNTSGLQKYPPCFTSIFVCTTVLASSCLPWPTVSLFCHSSKCLATFSCSVFCLSLASQDTRRRTQNVIFTFLFVVENPLQRGDTYQAPRL